MPFDGGQGTYNQGLAVDPEDPDKVFVGANLALYRTQNGGGSWEQVTHWAGFTRVYSHADLHATAWSKTGPPLAPRWIPSLRRWHTPAR